MSQIQEIIGRAKEREREIDNDHIAAEENTAEFIKEKGHFSG